jgi:hypothetical protein
LILFAFCGANLAMMLAVWPEYGVIVLIPGMIAFAGRLRVLA